MISLILIKQILVVLASSVVNRFRGGGFYSDKIPVKALWMAAPMIGGLAYVFHTPYMAGFFALAYLAWALLPWGLWYDHGRLVLHNRSYSKYEEGVEAISNKICTMFKSQSLWAHDLISHFIRHLMMIPAMAILAFWSGNLMYLYLAIPLAFLVVLLYEIGWILYDKGIVDNPIEIAELLVGLTWGVLIVAM
jgi:hypothetical protein